MRDRRHHLLRLAIEQGLLPPDAGHDHTTGRPWPVVLLIGFGAWLAGMLLCAGITTFLHRWLGNGWTTYAVAAVALTFAAAILRRQQLGVFPEQMATPILITGIALTYDALQRDTRTALAQIATALLLALLAALLRHTWLRALLGAGAAMMLALAWHDLVPHTRFESQLQHGVWLVLLAAWLVSQAVQTRLSAGGAALLEAFGSGWLAMVILGLAWWSGQAYLLSAGSEAGALHSAPSGWAAPYNPLPWLSVVLAVAAAWHVQNRWRTLRTLAGCTSAAVLVWLAWAAPAFGPVVLAAAVCLVSQRWRLAALGGVALIWIMGSFYYQLSWTLQHKAGVLIGAGAALGLAVWLSRSAPPGSPSKPARMRSWAVLPGLLATLAVVNISIHEKEQLIAHGRPVYVALRPVDPRSLTQGDYMRLDFGVDESLREHEPAGRTAILRMKIDRRGIATPLRPHQNAAAASIVRLPIKRDRWNWILVTDAWYFREGDADRWARARYGEFRVDGRGGAVLVGLVDEKLRPL